MVLFGQVGPCCYTFRVPREYGGVVLIGAASAIVLSWQSCAVSVMRRKLGIQYPTMYTDDLLFNCYQRAHQNTLESYPQFLAFLLLSGLHAPRFTIAAGTGWLVGRVVYSCGYQTGGASYLDQVLSLSKHVPPDKTKKAIFADDFAEPSKFTPGALMSNTCQILLLGGAVYSGLKFLDVY